MKRAKKRQEKLILFCHWPLINVWTPDFESSLLWNADEILKILDPEGNSPHPSPLDLYLHPLPIPLPLHLYLHPLPTTLSPPTHPHFVTTSPPPHLNLLHSPSPFSCLTNYILVVFMYMSGRIFSHHFVFEMLKSMTFFLYKILLLVYTVFLYCQGCCNRSVVHLAHAVCLFLVIFTYF